MEDRIKSKNRKIRVPARVFSQWRGAREKEESSEGVGLGACHHFGFDTPANFVGGGEGHELSLKTGCFWWKLAEEEGGKFGTEIGNLLHREKKYTKKILIVGPPNGLKTTKGEET